MGVVPTMGVALGGPPNIMGVAKMVWSTRGWCLGMVGQTEPVKLGCWLEWIGWNLWESALLHGGVGKFGDTLLWATLGAWLPGVCGTQSGCDVQLGGTE